MSHPNFEELLMKMPEIAKAVNAFSSESVQQKAFEFLAHSLLGVHSSQKAPAASTEKATAPETGSEHKKSGNGKKSKPGKLTIVDGFDVQPKQLRTLLDEKNPSSHDERFPVFTYYLKERLKVEKVSFNHIFTCYKKMGIPVPVNLPVQLRNCAYRRQWIDCSSKDDITLTDSGENFVEHELPRSTPEKK